MNKLETIKCKLLLDKRVVFLSTLMVQLPISFSDKCPTACTDGKSILINLTTIILLLIGVNVSATNYTLSSSSITI